MYNKYNMPGGSACGYPARQDWGIPNIGNGAVRGSIGTRSDLSVILSVSAGFAVSRIKGLPRPYRLFRCQESPA